MYDQLKAIFEAQKSFTEVKNSARLKKALKVRPQKMEMYQTWEKFSTNFVQIQDGTAQVL